MRKAREDKGMTLVDVAEVTRVSQRQLEAIERSDFHALPGTPYAVGFARAYARAVGADEVAIARGVREELGAVDGAQPYEAFEPVDPARIPPRRLAWLAAAIALVLAVGYGVWRTQFFAASTDQEISDLSNRASVQPAPAARPAPAVVAPVLGPVVLTATDKVWLRIYDQAGNRLLEKEMAKGESYTVPAGANDPMILTGRPDALAVTVGGKPVAPLGPPDRSVADLPIGAAALLARPGETAAAPVASSSAVPAAPASVPAAPAPRNAPKPVVSAPPAPSRPPVNASGSPAPAATHSDTPAVQPAAADPPAGN